MDSKEIKTALKNAREAIRKKEFKEALKYCKSVLNHEENNYMALVLVAVSAEGLEQIDQAIKTYKRAIAADDTQLLAWQGLSACYEKHPKPKYQQDHVAVYLKVAELQKSDKEKRLDIGIKLSKLAHETVKQSDLNQVIELLQSLMTDVEDDDKILQLKKSLLDVIQYLQQESSSDMIITTASDILEKTDNYNEDVERTITLYLSHLVKRSPEKMKEVCDGLLVKYSKSVCVIKYTIIGMLDSYIGDIKLVIPDKLMDIFTVYKDSNPDDDDDIVPLVDGFLTLCNKDYNGARELFKQVSGHYVCVPFFEAIALLHCHFYDGVVQQCATGIKMPQSKDRILTSSSSDACRSFNVLRVAALCAIGDKQSLTDALKTIDNELDSSLEDVMLLKGQVLLKQGNIDDAKTCVVGTSSGRYVLEGLIGMTEQNFDNAAEKFNTALEMKPGDVSIQVNLAKCLWKLSDRRQECYPLLLKSAKMDPYYCDTFLYLGHYYSEEVNDDVRASKCYTKAYNLDPSNDEAGEALCDLLNKLGEEEKAHEILLKVTQQAPAGSSKWAWLRLGLYQIKNEDTSEAIRSLLFALSSDPSNTHILECLGEAYLTRGSYTAALKVFTKVSQLDPDSMYPLFQLASIKQTLGTYTEAIDEYKLILEKSPNYVPALKGIGESYVQVAKSLLSKYFHGRACDMVQLAVQHLTRAVCVRPDMSCLWKLMGDACTILHVLPSENFKFEKSDKSVMTKLETLQFGGRCYIKALKILPECSSLWHDLGVNYLYQSLDTVETEAAFSLAEKSVQSLKKAIEVEPTNHRHWNALGYMACQKVYNKPDLAQHCFIKSIQAERNNVTAWTNLAALYLSKENVSLAHEAFKIAQSLEPSYVQCWIGQAIIAEVIGHEDAMDLYRHTTELGNHIESAIGYGHWVCTMLQATEKRDSYIYMYAIEQMGAVPAASDVLARYTDRVKTNVSAYNMYGLLLERQHLYKTACHQFKLAVDILRTTNSESSMLYDVMCNYARVLGKSGDYSTACDVYSKIPEVTSFIDLCQMALAYFKIQNLEKSFEVYNKASELATTEEDKSHVLTAMSMVTYKYGDSNTAKTALFQSSQLSQPSVTGLKALCALGVVQSDVTLAEAALQELFNLEVKLDHMYDIPLLSSAVLIMKGNLIEVKRQLQKLLHYNPCQSRVWQLLSVILLKYFPDLGQHAAQLARISLTMESPRQQSSLFLVSSGELYSGCHGNNTHNALLTAQRSILVKPDDLNNWINLVSCIHGEAMVTSDWDSKLTLLKQELNLLTYIHTQELRMESRLWCMKQKIVCAVNCNLHNELMEYLDELMTEFGSQTDIQQMFKVFSNVLQNNTNGVSTVINDNSIVYFWQILIDMYIKSGLIKDVEKSIQHCAGILSNGAESILQLKLAHAAFCEVMKHGSDSDYYLQVFTSTVDEMIKSGYYLSIVYLMQGAINMRENTRFSKNRFEKVLSCTTSSNPPGKDLSMARQGLLYILTSMKKDSELNEVILQEATVSEDSATLDYYKTINSE
ncbi:Tetratricopeptide repeat protein 37 [Mactra antiquata]